VGVVAEAGKRKMSDLFSLKGRTALVTGARRGIGRAIAVGLAQAGADLLLVGRTDDLHETAALVKDAGGTAEQAALDLAEPAAVPDAAAALLAHRCVDVLVNNAGVIRREPATTVDYAGWRQVLDVNLDAAFLLTQACAASMLARRQGKIITIASLLSFQGGINVVPYTASKHAVAGMTKALANEWGPCGVQVNAIAPGYIATDNTRPLREEPEREAAIRERIPAGRWGRPEDLVGAAVFLASPASDYVNGHLLVVDGGWLGR
jgi:2-dehydro-3-deoxy-D-gluconate 5-dehydrogenase